MTAVLSLVEYRNTETIALLRALLVAATSGDVVGIDARVRIRAGKERTVKSGLCKDQEEDAWPDSGTVP